MYDIIVAGAGPAGLTAGLYAARAGKKVLIFESNNIGGQANYSPLIENYPGLPATSGTEFAETLKEQVLSKGVEIRGEEVTSLVPLQNISNTVCEKEADSYVILCECASAANGETKAPTSSGAEQPSVQSKLTNENSANLIKIITDKNQYLAKAVILALGLEHRRLGLPGEDELTGMGVSYCAVCDGAFYGGAKVAVVGGGNSALQEALYLSSICSEVTLIHRREEFRGEDYLVKQLKEKDNVKFLLGYTISELLSHDGELKGLKLKKKCSTSAEVYCVGSVASDAYAGQPEEPDASETDAVANKSVAPDAAETDAGAEEEIAADGLFVSIGYIPGRVPEILREDKNSLGTSDPLKTYSVINTSEEENNLTESAINSPESKIDSRGCISINTNGSGFILTDEDCATNIPGIFAAGDCRKKKVRQLTTAVGDGAAAALSACDYINDNGHL